MHLKLGIGSTLAVHVRVADVTVSSLRVLRHGAFYCALHFDTEQLRFMEVFCSLRAISTPTLSYLGASRYVADEASVTR